MHENAATDADSEIEELDGAVSLADEVVDPAIGLTDEEAFAYKIVRRAASLKGVRIDRDAFLRTELAKRCPSDMVKAAVETTTQLAGVPMETMDAIADEAISLETKKVAGLSALAGVPGGLAVIGTIPADLVNYFAHVLRIEQKLAYVYGWPSFLDDEDEIDDETMYKLILFLGVILQVGGINVSLTNFATRTAAIGVAKSIEKQALTKTAWYPILKKVLAVLGVKVTKQNFASTVAKGVPILGGVVSGGITWATYKPGANSLKNHLRLLPQATGGVVDEAGLEAALEAESERERMEFEERLSQMRTDAFEFASNAASTVSEKAQATTSSVGATLGSTAAAASEAARSVADSMGGRLGGLTSRFKRKGPAKADASVSNAAEELRVLKSLLDDGIITQGDFDAKKAVLLGL